ncbi:unnamed protein product, partial [Staurois parvus]
MKSPAARGAISRMDWGRQKLLGGNLLIVGGAETHYWGGISSLWEGQRHKLLQEISPLWEGQRHKLLGGSPHCGRGRNTNYWGESPHCGRG